MVLRMYGAEEVDERSGGEYYRIVARPGAAAPTCRCRASTS